MSTEQHKSVLRDMVHAMNQGDLDRATRDLGRDFVYEGPGAEPVRGPEAYRKLLSMYRKAFPDMRFEIQHMVAEGNTVVTLLRITGTHKGAFQGIPATGRSVVNPVASVATFEGGKIVAEREYFDAMGLLGQLGALPEEVAG